jgi:hypothetical protein
VSGQIPDREGSERKTLEHKLQDGPLCSSGFGERVPQKTPVEMCQVKYLTASGDSEGNGSGYSGMDRLFIRFQLGKAEGHGIT